MDNELEVVNNDAVINSVEAVAKPSVLKTAGPIAGGVLLGIGAGYALCRWVITPLLEKKKAKKAEEKKPKAKEEASNTEE